MGENAQKYLDKELMAELKMNLIRINDRYSFAKEEKLRKIVNVTRKILKSFFGIDGEKIVDAKYEKKDIGEYVESVLVPKSEEQHMSMLGMGVGNPLATAQQLAAQQMAAQQQQQAMQLLAGQRAAAQQR